MNDRAKLTSTSKMRAIDTWDVADERIGYCAEQLRRGRVSLFLGAGVSAAFGLPSWDDLLSSAYSAAALQPLPQEVDVGRKAEHLKNHIAKSGGNYPRAVRDALYQSYDRSAERLVGSKLLLSIGAMAMASTRGSASRIVTYNYDTILETFLRYFGHHTASIVDLPAWQSDADIEVYHPHGLLPPDEEIDRNERLVFTEEEYDRLIGKQGEIWNELQLDIMRRHTCIFIGLSGNDKRLTSLMMRAKEQHAANQAYNYWGISFYKEEAGRPDVPGFWKTRGIYPILVKDYSEISTFLFSVCQKASLNSMSQGD